MVLLLALSLVVVAEPPTELKRLVDEARIAAASTRDEGRMPSELMPKVDAIVRFGADAIPLSVPLLKHPSPGVRTFFGYVVRRLPGLTPRELPALIAAHRLGNWLDPAIASIQTPEAAAFLLGEFLKWPSHTFSINQFGDRTVTALTGALGAKVAVHSDFADGSCTVFQQIGESAAKAVPELLSIMRNAQLPTRNRAAATSLLGCLPTISEETKGAIDAAIRSSPELARATARSEVQMRLGTPDGIANALARLASHPEEVANLRPGRQAARIAEPAVLALLDGPRAEIRLEAISTLGAIGGEASVTRLEALLSDERDWQAPCAAARALAELKSTGSTDVIRMASKTAWYPPSATCLNEAARNLDRGLTPEPPRFAEVPDGAEFRLSPPPTLSRGPDELDEPARKKLRVTGKVVSWGEGGEHIRNVTAAPPFALAIDGGVLAGTDRGEWGGELALLRRGQLVLLEENVHGIHRVGSQVLVITGLAHMSMNSGAIYRLTWAADGGPQLSQWRMLPGAPNRSAVLPNGRLFISCNGGDVIVDESGAISLATPELAK